MGVFDKIHHVCIVVHDIDKSQAYYESIGIGPWRAYPPLAEYTDLQVPNPSAFMNMRYQICDMPTIQLQLCQPPQEDCPQRRFLDTKGEGVFHIGFEVPDCEAGEAEADARGLAVAMRGRRPDGSGFAYFDTASAAGVILEIRATPRIGTK